MKRRNFLKILGLALVAPKAAVEALRKPKPESGAVGVQYNYLTDDSTWFLTRTPQKHVYYSKGIVVKGNCKNYWNDKLLKEFMQSCIRTREREAAKIFNNAFTTRHRS